MKVVTPGELVRDAADVLAPIWEEVVVIGAAALQILLADGLVGGALVTRDLDIAQVTPTQDVDVALRGAGADTVIACLEDADLKPSEEPHEQGFTWVRGDLKIQLVRPYHPFPNAIEKRLPLGTHLSLVAKEEHRLRVAFDSEPDRPRLQSASAAALVALKAVAFGRVRANGVPVERDFHDVYLVAAHCPDDLETTYRLADYHVRSLVDKALGTLAGGGDESKAAARQEVLIRGDGDLAATEESIVRSAVLMQRRLAA